ncbi:MAG: TonB-dependent receptor, partial [Xanthomonadales bacterium]|nr:TonB-dependent receptor [Xanthomonadales bacterium]
DPNGAYDTITLSTHQGWQEVEYFANQANLLIENEVAGGHNNLIIGTEYTDHKVLNGVFNVANGGVTNCVTPGRGANSSPQANFCGIGPDGNAVGNINDLLGRQITRGRWDGDWQVETVSAYVMDTHDFSEALTVFGGLRWDSFDYRLLTQNNALEVTRYEYDDSFWNGHLGVTYRLNDAAMIYASFATAADVNGGESDVGTSASYGGLQTIGGEFRGGSPERSQNWELGTKLNIFDERFLLTAAIFQTTKKDVFESASGGYTPEGTGNTGENRVRGFELGLAGNITQAWSIQGGLTVLDTEVLESAANPLNVGKTLANTADFQASLQTRYQLTEAFAFGAAIKHKGERYGGQPDTAANYVTRDDGSFEYSNTVPSYTVTDLFAEYRFNPNLSLRVNVNNVFDKDYYTAVYRSGAFLYKGDARQTVATLNLRF